MNIFGIMYGKGRVKVIPQVPCACTEGTWGMTLTSEANEEREALRVSARWETTSEANEEREALRVSARLHSFCCGLWGVCI